LISWNFAESGDARGLAARLRLCFIARRRACYAFAQLRFDLYRSASNSVAPEPARRPGEFGRVHALAAEPVFGVVGDLDGIIEIAGSPGIVTTPARTLPSPPGGATGLEFVVDHEHRRLVVVAPVDVRRDASLPPLPPRRSRRAANTIGDEGGDALRVARRR